MNSVHPTGLMVLPFLVVSFAAAYISFNWSVSQPIKNFIKNGVAYIVLGIPTLLVLLWYVPKWQMTSVAAHLSAKDTISAENEIRKTWSQTFGYIGGIALLLIAWKRITVSQEGQITDRFTRAIEHLGSKETEVRMGGIYALERIAKDSRKDHFVVMEILTAYVRERAPVQKQKAKLTGGNTHPTVYPSPQPPTHPTPIEDDGFAVSVLADDKASSTDGTNAPPEDIQAAIRVIGRRKVSFDPDFGFNINLSKCNLPGISFQNGDFTNAILDESNLQNAILINTKLDCASLMWCNLNEATLRNASLRRTNLTLAILHESELVNSDLSYADLVEAKFKSAKLKGANLENANAQACDLSRADLRGTNLEGTLLDGASLEGVIWS